ncbi:hypothetical protein JTE90_024271 [Oedothorax gibbosus]|uniref:28S ribosomal protein S36, mitochondrial n=1 Tax=Oedothorax gibbosus TaxID=931172 RepID=A0AAV6VMF7_9ARAC|nr:hypothetical protein JTE90_024271 [Oedothorax gibbosus]
MSASARSWQVVKPHLPLIKFRYGKRENNQAMNPKQSSSLTNLGPQKLSQKGSGIDDTELPLKYFRKPLTQLEIETIERGGPE